MRKYGYMNIKKIKVYKMNKKYKSPPISKNELLYILDSLNDLDNGNYYFSRFGQTVEEFIKELQSDEK